jgi:hypothetical protein
VETLPTSWTVLRANQVRFSYSKRYNRRSYRPEISMWMSITEGWSCPTAFWVRADIWGGLFRDVWSERFWYCLNCIDTEWICHRSNCSSSIILNFLKLMYGMYISGFKGHLILQIRWSNHRFHIRLHYPNILYGVNKKRRKNTRHIETYIQYFWIIRMALLYLLIAAPGVGPQ